MPGMATSPAEIWTIAQLTRRVKNLLEAQIGRVWVSGEISNWKLAASGHAYFTLKDADSQVDAVIFRNALARTRFRPENGMEVLAYGQMSVYEKRGNYQLILEELQPRGQGSLQLAFERLKRRLDEEGLFDPAHKKPLPVLPRRIGIVTSPSGAAIRDILNVLNRRFANLHILLYPAKVQGAGAAEEIVAGIRALDAYGVDVMIVGRGGGSLEDLWSFNEEAVVRAVFAARTPIISAVGHEIDFSLCDFAADVRAPTPSAAAELVVREQQALVTEVQALERRLARGLNRRLEQARHRIAVLQRSYVLCRPEEMIRQRRQQADELSMRLEQHARGQLREAGVRLERAQRSLRLLSPVQRLCRDRERLGTLEARLAQAGRGTVRRADGVLQPIAAQLHALSPLAILSRGYALAWKMPERSLVRAASELKPKDTLLLRFGAGEATATVKQVQEAVES